MHGSVGECSNQKSPLPSEYQQRSSHDPSKASAHVAHNTDGCFQEHQKHYEEYISRKILSNEFRNVDIVSGTSEEDKNDGFSEAVFTAQEGHTLQNRSAKQVLEDCSKIQDTKSERLTTARGSSGTEKNKNLSHNFINCNKSPLPSNKILLPADKGTQLPKKTILENCEKSKILTAGEVVQATDQASIPRRETAPTIYNNNNRKTLQEKKLSTASIKSTEKQIMESYEKAPTAASDKVAEEHRKSQISGCESLVFSGEETAILQEQSSKEHFYRLYVRKGSLSTVKKVPVDRKGTLMRNDTRTQIEQKLLSGIEQNKQNSGMKDKQVLCYGKEKSFKKCDRDPVLKRDKFLFNGKEAAISRRKENESMRRTRLLFTDTETSTSEDIREAENYIRSPFSWKEKLVPSINSTSLSGGKTYMENLYTRPSQRKEDALLSRAKVNLGYSDGGHILRKNKLLATDKQTSLPTLQDKLSTEAEESVECVEVHVVDSGDKNEMSAVAAGDKEERDSAAGQRCRKRNPVSISNRLCEQNATSRPAESCTEIDRHGNLTSEFVILPSSDEDCVEQSLEDASTVIIHPLLSCRYEHTVPQIRKKLKNLHETLKDGDQGTVAIHDESIFWDVTTCCPVGVHQHIS